MTRKVQIENILSTYRAGLRSEDEALVALDLLKVRGTFTGPTFIGFDYAAQRWLRI